MIEPRTDKQRHWAKILSDAESSGKSLADYARSNDYRAQTLYQWRSTLKQQEPSVGRAPVHFSQVVTTPSAYAVTVEVNLARLRFDQLPDVEWLSALISSQSDAL